MPAGAGAGMGNDVIKSLSEKTPLRGVYLFTVTCATIDTLRQVWRMYRQE